MPAKLRFLSLFAFTLFFISVGCNNNGLGSSSASAQTPVESPRVQEISSPEVRKLLEHAVRQLELTKTYDPAYVVLDYPNGDIPIEKGVCTDVVIRAMRNAGVDLQKVVHEDMSSDFSAYPNKWGLTSPDRNIDHRRVPNLRTFFERKGKSLPVTKDPKTYQPGDIVSWDLDGKGMTHIGIVSNRLNERTKTYLIIHNIGSGAQLEDRLFGWEITGHYRYF